MWFLLIFTISTTMPPNIQAIPTSSPTECAAFLMQAKSMLRKEVGVNWHAECKQLGIT